MTILKQLVGWVTDLKHRFNHDIFFSTRVKIIISLSVFVGIVIVSLTVLINCLKNTITARVVDLQYVVVNKGTIDQIILSDLNQRAESVTYTVIFFIISFGIVFALIVSRFAVTPIRQAFQLQKRFISGIAHEIRTPLSIIRINNEIMRFDMDSASPIAKLLDNTIRDIDHISEMLNNLLLFDRMLLATPLQLNETSLINVINNVVERLSELATQKNVLFVIDQPPLPTILGNESALGQVFFNLLKNAISYNQPGGTIHITFEERSGGSVLIRIIDTGLGIPKADIPHIFDPFYHAGKVGKLSGTGVGLAIVFEIVKLHNGAITVESNEGIGTTFLLSFPIFQSDETTDSLFIKKGGAQIV